jgi:hypothetical protein
MYPGNPDGTISERIAYAITTQVIDRATHLIDMHCGDGNESLRPYSYWMPIGDDKVDGPAREMVLAFGLDYIVVDGAGRTYPRSVRQRPPRDPRPVRGGNAVRRRHASRQRRRAPRHGRRLAVSEALSVVSVLAVVNGLFSSYRREHSPQSTQRSQR